MATAFRIAVNKKKAVTYCQQALLTLKVFIKCSLHCLLNILCFFLCHNLHLHMLITCGIGKTVLCILCARFKSRICKSRPPPPPTLRPRNSCICPCLSRRWRSMQISRLCPFSYRRQAELTPVQASCFFQ